MNNSGTSERAGVTSDTTFHSRGGKDLHMKPLAFVTGSFNWSWTTRFAFRMSDYALCSMRCLVSGSTYYSGLG